MTTEDTERATPETDAQVTTFSSISKFKKRFLCSTGKVSAQFARKLERERDEAREDLKITQEAWVKAKAERADALRHARHRAGNPAMSRRRGGREMSDTPETNAQAFDAFDGQGGDEVVFANLARRFERERDEAREDAAHWKTEYEIVVARLCGKKHPRDNGIISEHEIIPKLTQERDSARDELAALKRTAHWLYSRLRIYLDGEQFIGTAQRLERVGEENPWMKEPYNP